MMLVNEYSKSIPTHQTQSNNHLNPDQAEIARFVQWLHHLAQGLDGQLVMVAIEQRPEEARAQVRVKRFGVGDSTAMAKAAVEEAKREWANVYFGSSLVRPGLPPNARGSRDDIVAVLMLGVDQDADTGKEGPLPLEPNLVIQTSQEPTINRQAFYVFDPYDRPAVPEAHAVGEALRHATGADSGTGDIARVFRMPGTLNWPTPSKIRRGRPLSPQFAYIEKDASGYTSLGMLRGKIDITAGEVASESANLEPKALLKRASATLKKKLRAHDKDGDRSSAAYVAIMAALGEGFADDEIQVLVDAHPQGVGERYAGASTCKLTEDISRIREKWQNEMGECEQAFTRGQQAGLPSGFAHEPDGDLVRVDKANGQIHKVCSAIKVTAKIRDKESAGWGLVVRIMDPDGKEKQIIVPWRDLNVTSGERDAIGRLRDQGLQLYSTGAASELRDS